MWMKKWLVVFTLMILTFYIYYFIQIIRGKPEKFENLFIEGLLLETGENKGFSLSAIGCMVGFSLLLEIGYFTLCILNFKILLYRIVTAAFIGFEIWHNLTMIPLLKILAGKSEAHQEIMNWKIERISARIFVTHALITLILAFTI